MKEILAYHWLPARAACTIAILVAALVESGLALMPGQSLTWLGIEILVIGSAVLAGTLPQQIRVASLARIDEEHRPEMRNWAASTFLATAPAPIAGIVMIAGSTSGAYVLAAGILLTFLVAVLNAWVLLVEILR